MHLVATYDWEVKKSRFVGLLYLIDDLEQFKILYQKVKTDYTRADHICYAYQIQNQAKYSDAGEPKGTAGRPLYNLLNYYDLNNVCLVVVRYFGCIKLGAGGLVRAYSKTGSQTLKIWKQTK